MTSNPSLSITDFDILLNRLLCKRLSTEAIAIGDVVFQAGPEAMKLL